MPLIILRSTDQTPLYEGSHITINDAIDAAIRNNICLDGLDLSYQKIRHINLDGVTLRNASFKGADLTGANMSEASFINCDFSDCVLTNACLCYSKISNCNLRLSFFLDTDISMSDLEFCDFEGQNTFDLKLFTAASLTNLTYHDGPNPILFSTQPILVLQGNTRIIILEKSIIFNGKTHTFGQEMLNESIGVNSIQDTQPLMENYSSNFKD